MWVGCMEETKIVDKILIKGEEGEDHHKNEFQDE
jgi:hypothetical protein